MEKIDKYDLFGTRLLVFVEESPQSNKYRQIILNAEEFKKVSFSIGTITSRNGDDEMVEFQMSEELYDLPDLQEHQEYDKS